ncbi:lytic murein transglycosylase [Methylobacillus arboreus]|uniref:lytic murein transglycosylase n=1 Tax=Methylobacillus arboreus TaxID=755170 RepID=UPI001E2B5B8F|nr:lytic murein transglycosylase [Methylobacillus arboreus]MCB5190040.1 lytic murein transglycosylase [Methylobacillus arboreus]
MFKLRRSTACLLMVMLFAPVSHAAEQSFDEWLQDFSRDAQAQGISATSLQAALADAKPIDRVVELDQAQPEFVQTFMTYLTKRVTPRQIGRGQQLLQEQGALLQAVEQKYGVPAPVLLAFWGLETNYGQTLGGFSTPQALATLAYEGRRHAFFRSQLLDALRILDAGHVEARNMVGSWAGAVGHMQFMPSTFLAYAEDGDGDGKINVWQSIPDALYSAGHYLQSIGWKRDEPIAVEVSLPEGFAWQEAAINQKRSVGQWQALGVQALGQATLPPAERDAAVILPQGWRGPAFMVFDNFKVVMQWNRSTNYALTVAHLASRLRGAPSLSGGAGAEQYPVSIDAIKRLQQQLTELGFDTGGSDGLPGPKTQAAIRGYQLAHALPADGYASPSLMQHVATKLAAQTVDTELIPGFPGTQP